MPDLAPHHHSTPVAAGGDAVPTAVAPLGVLGLIAAVIVSAGSVGPWFVQGPVEIDGLQAGMHGAWTLLAGAAAVIAFAAQPALSQSPGRRVIWLGVAALAAAAALGTWRWLVLDVEPTGAAGVEIGWGLRLVLAAGWGGLGVGLAHVLGRGGEPAH